MISQRVVGHESDGLIEGLIKEQRSEDDGVER